MIPKKIIADKLNWSTGKKGQADVIDKKAPEPIKEKLRNNEMTINQAYEVTKQIEEIKEPELKAKIIDTIKQEPKKEVKKIIQEAKKEERKETLQAKAKELPAEKFQVLYCDPPWQYSNSGLNGSAESKYPTMATEDLCNMKIKTITAENAVIFMWATNPLLEDALKLMNAWGFEYKTNMVWTKDRQNFGKLGFYIWGQHELLLIGVKGSMLPIGDKPNSIITGSNNIHSKKPETVYEIIEQMYPELKYVELFARNTPRENWIKWGNEVGKYE
jgi:N6-adenosine-specific RNA methylase IME4